LRLTRPFIISRRLENAKQMAKWGMMWENFERDEKEADSRTEIQRIQDRDKQSVIPSYTFPIFHQRYALG